MVGTDELFEEIESLGFFFVGFNLLESSCDRLEVPFFFDSEDVKRETTEELC